MRIRESTYVAVLPKKDSAPLEVDLANGTIRRIGGGTCDRIIDLSRRSAPASLLDVASEVVVPAM